MILIDANVLIYAYDPENPHFEAAKEWLEVQFSSPGVVRLPWTVILAFSRITTDSRIVRRPLSRREASEIVSQWLGLPQVDVLAPGDRHWEILQQLIESGQVSGKLMMDAHLAAMAIEHGATLFSCDRDFARFDGLQWRNPLDLEAGWINESFS